MSILFGKKSKNRRESAAVKRKHHETVASTQESIEKPKHQFDEEVVVSPWATFGDLGLAEPLVETCRALGLKSPTQVQRQIIPFLLREDSSHVMALSETGSGKTAAFTLPLLHHLAKDPYGIFGVVISPTRELAKQIHQQILALGSSYNVQSVLVVGGMDMVQQACALDQKPHFVVATPGRLAELLRGPRPPKLNNVRFLVLDEADRLLAAKSGFERDVAELLLHCNQDKRTKCQTLLFSATMTRSLESVESIAGAGQGRLAIKKFVIRTADQTTSTGNERGKLLKLDSEKNAIIDTLESKSDEYSSDGGESLQDNDIADRRESEEVRKDKKSNDFSIMDAKQMTPQIPSGLKQEYIFMPSRVRDAYLLTTIRCLLSNGGRAKVSEGRNSWRGRARDPEVAEDDEETGKIRSIIVFVATCERAAIVSEILTQVGVDNVALHSLLSQNRRLAALAKFKSQKVQVLVATDIASRGLDVPSVDLVINSELPRNPVSYVHRIGRTARAGRRGRAISLVSDVDVPLVHAAEEITGRPLEKCVEITDENAIQMLGTVTKASRLAKMKLMDIGFDELVKKFKERKVRDRKERQRIERALRTNRTKKINDALYD